MEMMMFRRTLPALLCAAVMFSPVVGAQEGMTVTAGDAIIDVLPLSGAMGQLMSVESVSTLGCRIDNGSDLGGYSVTAQADTPLTLMPNGVDRLIRLQVSLNCGAYAELVNQLGQAQPASTLGIVSISMANQTYSWPLSYRASLYVDGSVAAGSYVFSVLFTFVEQ